MYRIITIHEKNHSTQYTNARAVIEEDLVLVYKQITKPSGMENIDLEKEILVGIHPLKKIYRLCSTAPDPIQPTTSTHPYHD